MRKGVIVRNRYYTDAGMDYAYDRLTRCLRDLGVSVEVKTPLLSLSAAGIAPLFDADFAVFWDKDTAMCRALELTGVRCFNRASAIAVCDDKLLTYLALEKSGLPLIETVAAPLVFPVSDPEDEAFVKRAAELGFPLIVKGRVGSRGEQVWLIKDRKELDEAVRRLKHTPFLCQRFVADSAGRDVRVYVVGDRAVCALERVGSDFKSNAAAGSRAQTIAAGPWAKKALRAAKILGLDYGAVDFLLDGSLVEVNSNAYFTAAERLGADVAGAYARHIVRSVYAGR